MYQILIVINLLELAIIPKFKYFLHDLSTLTKEVVMAEYLLVDFCFLPANSSQILHQFIPFQHLTLFFDDLLKLVRFLMFLEQAELELKYQDALESLPIKIMMAQKKEPIQLFQV